MGKTHRIGTVEMLKVKSSGRRLYVNLAKELVDSFGIRKGDTLRVEIKERVEPDQPGSEGPDRGPVTVIEKCHGPPAEKQERG